MNKYPQAFIDEVYKILCAIEVEFKLKGQASFLSTQDVAQTWYTQWRDNRALKAGPITWEVFRRDFLDRFLPREKREAKVE